MKRLVASFEVAAREGGFDRKRRRAIVTRGSRSYRTAMHEFASMRLLDIWHSRLGISDFEQRWGAEASARAVKNFRPAATKAQSKDHLKAFGKLTRRIDGEIRFISDPPLLEPVSELFSDLDARLLDEIVASSLHSYRRTLPRSRQRLLDGYRFADLARKSSGWEV